MKFGARLRKAMAHMQWDTKTLSTESKTPIPTINAILRRDSDRSDYKDALVDAFPADKINLKWLRSDEGDMLDVQPATQQLAKPLHKPAGCEELTHEAIELGRWFDMIPESDPSRRKLAYLMASDVIADVRRGRLVDLPIDMPDQAHPQEKKAASGQLTPTGGSTL